MVCSSLLHCGDELLGRRGALELDVSEHGTMGIPLLHPWANRLSKRRFSIGGQQVDVGRAHGLAAEDPNGLPIHGLLLGHPGWRVCKAEVGPAGAVLRATFDFSSDPRLLAAFPFPHQLEIEVTLLGATISHRTMLHAIGTTAMPVSFGYHPYLRLPGARRSEWEIELPVKWHLLVDSLMIPTGKREPAIGVKAGPLGERTFDDGYADIAPGSRFVAAGCGRRIEMVFEAGYPIAQVYAPDDEEIVCFEPMTAPTNALVSGDGLSWVRPGESFSAQFSLAIGEQAHS